MIDELFQRSMSPNCSISATTCRFEFNSAPACAIMASNQSSNLLNISRRLPENWNKVNIITVRTKRTHYQSFFRWRWWELIRCRIPVKIKTQYMRWIKPQIIFIHCADTEWLKATSTTGFCKSAVCHTALTRNIPLLFARQYPMNLALIIPLIYIFCTFWYR